jgi:alkylhydroperoxidase/carboxymuconolactone decarboxylase family protein YurZ
MLTPLRPLTPDEQTALTKLRAHASAPPQLDALLREIIVARAAVRTVRTSWRCLPPHVRDAINGLPHRPQGTAQEYRHD